MWQIIREPVNTSVYQRLLTIAPGFKIMAKRWHKRAIKRLEKKKKILSRNTRLLDTNFESITKRQFKKNNRIVEHPFEIASPSKLINSVEPNSG